MAVGQHGTRRHSRPAPPTARTELMECIPDISLTITVAKLKCDAIAISVAPYSVDAWRVIDLCADPRSGQLPVHQWHTQHASAFNGILAQ